MMAPTFLVWASKYKWMPPTKRREDGGREGWWAGRGSEHPLAVPSGAAGAQELQGG